MPVNRTVIASTLFLVLSAAATTVWAINFQQAGKEEEQREQPRRHRVTREELLKNYDLSNPIIDIDKLLAPGVDKDGIPALTNPRWVKVADSDYPANPKARVVEVTAGGQAVAYPLGILNWHEIANDVVGDMPVAVTYCPLCDSVAVFDRRITSQDENGKATVRTLEFGVSGLLYNSNVVMYERHNMGLWSQVYMRAVTGPDSGTMLKSLPVRMMTWEEFKKAHPDGEVLSTDTGHDRPYNANPYEGYLKSDRVFGQFDFGHALPPKTLGVGIAAGDFVTFITADAMPEGKATVHTPGGDVQIVHEDAGFRVVDKPDNVAALQTFYHSWSAYYPDTKIITEPAAKAQTEGN